MEEKGGAGGDFLLISKLTLSLIHCRFCSADTALRGAARRDFITSNCIFMGKNWNLVDLVPFKIETGIKGFYTAKKYYKIYVYSNVLLATYEEILERYRCLIFINLYQSYLRQTYKEVKWRLTIEND